jgi:hypothetical protein
MAARKGVAVFVFVYALPAFDGYRPLQMGKHGPARRN